jgi:hypothetical protein
MTDWQPDWQALQTTAAPLIASDPLAAVITSVTPVGGYVAIALQATLSDVVSAATKAGPLSGPLVIAVDTLNIGPEDPVIAAPGVSIVARAVVVNGGPASLIVRSDTPQAGIQLTTAEISGSLNAAFQKADGSAMAGPGSGPLAMSGLAYPQVITVSAASVSAASTAQQDVADSLHEPWAIVALEVSAAIAATLVDQGSGGALALAADMLGWVTGGCSALFAQQSQYQNVVDFGNLASLQATAVGLLSFTQAQTSGATYVPMLSADVYQQQINSLLALAQLYDGKIAAFQNQQNTDQLLASFASTLGDTYQEAQTPLLNALQRLAAESGLVEEQLINAAGQLQEVSATLGPLQQALVNAINDQLQQELVQSAVDTLSTLATLYVGAAGAILGDPEVLAGQATALIKVATDTTKELIDLGQKTTDEAISDGASSAALPPTPQNSAGTAQGAQYLAGSLANFGSAVALLWVVVAQVASSQPLNLSADLANTVGKLPDLSGFSVGGLDPVTYWNAVVVQTTAAVKPHEDLPAATAYLEAVQLAATYGSAVGDLQMKLLELYAQGMTAFDQLYAAYQAQASWTQLQKSLTSTADQVAAAAGLLQRGYLNIKRSLVLAVEDYRAAFLYQWLQPAGIQIDVSMDLLTLQQQATNSITELNQVLAGTLTGPVRPRQSFQGVTYKVTQATPFTQVNGNAQAQFTMDPTALAEQLDGNTALFLSAATFELEGGTQSGEVELQITTSGHYNNQLGTNAFRFVSRPVSMSNDYTPGNPPNFLTQWQFADAAMYLAPTPYTNWTLTVDKGQWQDVTAINLTLSGILLQNP